MRHRVRSFAILLGVLLPGLAMARTLNWAELSVTAKLDAEGRLHVRELQAMVFDGDWNGGERSFRLRGDQAIVLHGITRVEPSSRSTIELRQGSLDRVDEYDWVDGRTLRWRSRLPSDPEFDDETIIYVLEYTMSGVIEKKRGAYILAHDFAFPDRYGTIERFNLELEIDPVWQPREEFAGRVEAQNLLPGESFVVFAKLDFTGAGRPAAVFEPPPLGVRLPLVVAALAAVAHFFVRFRRHEEQRGRYDPPDIPAEPGRDWVEEQLLELRPEVVGALWDQSIGGPEVSALLARLVAEGKLASRVEETPSRWKQDILHLELLVDRDEFKTYERELVDKLFFDGRTEISTEAVREHYKSEGFSPAAAITGKLKQRLGRIRGFGSQEPEESKHVGLAILAAIVALVVLEGVTRRAQAGVLIVALVLSMVVPVIVGYIGVFWRRRKADELLAPTLLFVIPLAVILSALFMPVLLGTLLVPYPMKLSWAGMAALLVAGVAVARSFFSNARTRDDEEAVRNRKRLASIRRYFKEELRKPLPNLEDDWFPYLLAFGLAGDVDRWSVAHASSSGFSTTGTGGFSGSSGGGGWTGGGGRFGGAGASAGWAAAATGLAAGVASPSSSGGGGGGGGGGSSGGGGGGGW